MKAGWQFKKFGEVLEIRNGKNQREVESENGVYPIFGSAGNVMGYASAYICEAGATIIGRKGNINTPVYSETRFWNVDTAFGLVAKPSLDCKFLYYYCLFFDFGALNRGTTIPSLVKSELLEISIPLPPLPEQHRIVALLDEAFDGIATARANTEKNLQNARALFESYLQSVFADRGEEWVEKPLAELCDISRVITYGVIKLGDEVENGVPCLRTSNVRWLRIETEGMKRIAPELSAEYSRTILKGGEVLVNVRGTLGGVAVVSPDMAGWNVSREVAVVPVHAREVNPIFLSYFIGSGASQKWLGRVKKGAAYVGINIEDLRMLPVSAPNIERQLQVVERLKDFETETQRLESLYQRKLNALDELKQSLLYQAFSGQL